MAKPMYILLSLLALIAACSCALDRQARAERIADRIQGYCQAGETDSLRIYADGLAEEEKSDPAVTDQAFERGTEAYGTALALLCTPDSAAARFVARLLSLESDKGDLARRTAQGIVESYAALGMERECALFERGVDSIAATLTLEQQVSLYMLVATPGMLGVKARGEDPEMIRAIENRYGSDQESLELFRKGLKGD